MSHFFKCCLRVFKNSFYLHSGLLFTAKTFKTAIRHSINLFMFTIGIYGLAIPYNHCKVILILLRFFKYPVNSIKLLNCANIIKTLNLYAIIACYLGSIKYIISVFRLNLHKIKQNQQL